MVLREKKSHMYSKMIPLQACKRPTNHTFERTQHIVRDRKILLKKNGSKRYSQSHFCGFAQDMITNTWGEANRPEQRPNND